MTPKTIAINTRFLLKNRLEGIGRFTYEIVKRMVLAHPEHHFVFLFDRAYDPSFLFADNITPLVLFPPARHPILWYAWFEWAVPHALRKVKADVFLSTDGFLSLKTSTPTVLVIHDLAFEHFPEQVPYLVRHYYQYFTPTYAHKAQHIIAVSDYTKQDIIQQYKVAAPKISVVHNAVDASIYQPISLQEREEVQQIYTNSYPYFLFVGAIHPRKNLANILQAYDDFKQKSQSKVKMLIVGRKAWQSQAAFDAYQAMQYQSEVIFLGHLQSKELAKVLGGALALVYTSFFEGFGIPILEAMQCEVPVITSNVSSMPEVCGNAGILVNPKEVSEISAAMLVLSTKTELRQQYIDLGKQRRTAFSWDKSAKQVYQVIENCLTAKRR